MASLKDTKRRIMSVKNTQKITRAMKLVASSKYMRAVSNLARARPYSEAFQEVVKEIVGSSTVENPLLQSKDTERKSLIVVLSTDRGLCGPLNANLFKHVQSFIDSKRLAVDFSLELWGKKASLFGKYSNEKVVSSIDKVLEKPSYPFAQEAVRRFFTHFKEGEFDSVYLAYSSFRNALSQPPNIKKILPLSENISEEGEKEKQTAADMLFEPRVDVMLDSLLFRYGVSLIYRYILEASSAEHSARMTAMDSATNNADKVIKNLTLEYNRARQASITRELIEITSGAEALN